MRRPTPGMLRIWASVAVLMLIGTIAVPLVLVLLAGVLDAAADGATAVSLTAIAVSACVCDLRPQAATTKTAKSVNSVGWLMKRVMRDSPVVFRRPRRRV